MNRNKCEIKSQAYISIIFCISNKISNNPKSLSINKWNPKQGEITINNLGKPETNKNYHNKE